MKSFLIVALFSVANVFGFRAVSTRFSKNTLKLSLADVSNVLIESNFNLAGGTLVLGTICGALENLKEIETDKNNKSLEAFKFIFAKLFGALAVFLTVFGVFFAYQTNTLRFQFDKDSFSLIKADGSSMGENVAVGGENSWKYSSFVNYDFLPSEKFPILVYFKETQTPESARLDAPIIVDKLVGQQHFFPCIANSVQLQQNFASHNCKKDLSTSNSAVTVSLEPSKSGRNKILF